MVIYVTMFIIGFYFVKMTVLFCLAINSKACFSSKILSRAEREKVCSFSTVNKPRAFIIKENAECKGI